MAYSTPLLNDVIAKAPLTQGIKYAGSKLTLLPQILQLVNRVKPKTVLDGFAGSARASQALAKSGYKVISNDISNWSKIFSTCYLLNKKSKSSYIDLIDHLNHLASKDGWFTEHYGGLPNNGCAIQKDTLKKPWQIHNTRKLDAIREEIETLKLTEIEKAVALTSLILALDEVDNTLGHYAAYLKEWSPRSYKEMVLKVPEVFENWQENEVYQEDIFDLLDNTRVDLAYYDPPYGSNNEKMPPSRVRYAAYYHLWTSICLFDKPELFGKAKRRIDTSDSVASSVFEEFRKDASGKYIALEAIRQLISKTK
ncbi:MAG: DNA adenine methylase, partial [Deinococcales bacterium]